MMRLPTQRSLDVGPLLLQHRFDHAACGARLSKHCPDMCGRGGCLFCADWVSGHCSDLGRELIGKISPDLTLFRRAANRCCPEQLPVGYQHSDRAQLGRVGWFWLASLAGHAGIVPGAHHDRRGDDPQHCLGYRPHGLFLHASGRSAAAGASSDIQFSVGLVVLPTVKATVQLGNKLGRRRFGVAG